MFKCTLLGISSVFFVETLSVILQPKLLKTSKINEENHGYFYDENGKLLTPPQSYNDLQLFFKHLGSKQQLQLAFHNLTTYFHLPWYARYQILVFLHIIFIMKPSTGHQM